MVSFEYVAPADLHEVLERLADGQGEAVLLGGGTATVLLMKQQLLSPRLVIGLGRVADLRGARAASDGVRLGATCTLAELERSPVVQGAYPVLAATAHKVGNVRVRSVATLGGNLVHADPAQDLPPVLMALGASITLVSRRGLRQLRLDDLYVDYMTTCVEPDEVLAEVHLPPPPPHLYATYVKFTPRSQDDYATVGIACSLVLDGDRCAGAALVLGGVGATPLRVRAAEEMLTGMPLSRQRIAEAARAAEAAAEPWDDHRGSAAYKRAMSRVWTERALLDLARQAGLTL